MNFRDASKHCALALGRRSGWDYVRHGFVGAVTNTVLPDALTGRAHKVLDTWSSEIKPVEYAFHGIKKLTPAGSDFVAGYVNSMSQKNNWNPFDEQNTDESTVKGLENVAQGPFKFSDWTVGSAIPDLGVKGR